ncbi:MAG: tetratricopeptide repeat protein [Pseudolabrys sp.]
MPLSHQPQAEPLDLASTLAQAIALHEKGELAEAEQLYSAILAARPDHPDALHFLGLIRLTTGQPAEALRLVAAAMRAGPPSAFLMLNHGLALNALARPDEAIASFEHAIALDASFAQAHNNRAVLLSNLGRHEEALASYRAALALEPNNAGTLFNQANALKDLGRVEEAIASYDQALALQPDLAPAYCNRGIALHALKRHEQALASLDAALARAPGIAEAHLNRGSVLDDLKRHEDAITSYDNALSIRPDYAEALSNRGVALHALGRDDEALECFDRALTIRPDYAEALTHRGATFDAMQRYDEALASYNRAIALKPDFADAYGNRGTTFYNLKRLDDALADFDRALALRPDLPEVHWNQATARLITGDYARGFAEYEWRWQRETMASSKRDFPQPLWRGEDVEGKTVLLHSEQGFGDSIQFCRYAPALAARGARVILEVEAPLQRLMTTLVTPLAGGIEVIARGSAVPAFDAYCPLLSLPLAFGTQLDTVPSVTPYLHAQAEDIAGWNERLGDKRRPRIGLAWSGNPNHLRDSERSIALEALLPLTALDASFVSVQKDVRAADASALAGRSDILQVGEHLKDFADTAALIAALDLVITVDTSVAHLAGALGKPVWLLLPYIPDWRWLLERETSPWYPTARLFRQDETRRFDGVIARVREALSCGLASGRF